MAKPRKSYALWLTGHALRLLFTLLIAAVCFFMIWRVFISGNPPAKMKRLAANEQLVSAYRAHGEELTLYTQEQASVTKGESNYGYFGITRCVFIPDAEQIQITFRYNNSTLTHVQEDYGLAEAPERGIEIFDVSVVKVIDLTPDDTDDNTDDSENLSKLRIAPTDCQITTTSLYTYCLYTFDGVAMTKDTIAAFFDIYYEDDIDYTDAAYGTLRLYHAESPNIPLELTRKEIKALKAYEES